MLMHTKGFAILTVNPKEIDDAEYQAFMTDLALFVKLKTQSKGIPLTALGIREYSGVSTPDPDTPVNLLWGNPEVHEKLINYKYRGDPIIKFMYVDFECL